MSLRAHLVLRRSGFALDLSLEVRPGEVVALLGPNGAGKSTALRLLAGLQSVDEGSVVLDDTVLDDAAAGVFVPAEQRSVSVVFQDHLLFPHLSARENVAFGLRARGGRALVARAAADEWLVRVALEGLGARRPSQLSGGQQQRVALAREIGRAHV